MELYKRVAPHNDRVRYDGGNETRNMADLFLLQRSNEELKDFIKLSYCPELTGNKVRTSGVNSFVTKGYSTDQLRATGNDLIQPTAVNQPYLDKVAPTEKLGIKNPNNGSAYLTHPTISFGATDEWSVEMVLINGINQGIVSRPIMSTIPAIGGGDGIQFSFVNLKLGLISKNPDLVQVNFDNSNFYTYEGKTLVVSIVKDTFNNVSLYYNGTLKSTKIWSRTFDFNAIGLGALVNGFSGKIYSYHIFNKAITPYIASRTAILRSIFPEVESVTIGSQTWAVRNAEVVCSAMGNLIAEMQAATNVEKITNAADRGFDSDTGFWNKQAGWTISSGTANFNGSAQSSFYNSSVVANKWYKITYTITNISNGQVRIVGGSGSIYRSNAGTYTEYLYITAGTGIFALTGTIVSIDNISIQEVGWSDSQAVYDFVYANTTGTTEQKTYAAVKASSFWCHYNNDPSLGVTYGKLYNWFAVKLLQMDIDYYNAANPTTPFGWKVPSQADFQALSTYLGGDSVSGGKLKLAGTTYWNSPNTGADNSSGFSAIGGGNRGLDGSFSSIGVYSPILTVDSGRLRLDNNALSTSILGTTNIYGFSLRLIKS